jgi:hypothetical protein
VGSGVFDRVLDDGAGVARSARVPGRLGVDDVALDTVAGLERHEEGLERDAEVARRLPRRSSGYLSARAASTPAGGHAEERAIPGGSTLVTLAVG